MTRTGRENRIVFYCPKCGWRTEALALPLREARPAASGQCEGCGHRGLGFVSWEAGVEDAEAEAAVAQRVAQARKSG